MRKCIGGKLLTIVGISLALWISFAAGVYAQTSTSDLLTIACNEVVQGLKLTGSAPSDTEVALKASIPEAREAAANVVSSRLLAQLEFIRVDLEELKGFIAALEALGNNGATAECRSVIFPALITAYNEDDDVEGDPTLILPDASLSFEVNRARAEAIYNHPACSSDFRRKDPRVVLEEHEAVARGIGNVECAGVVTAKGSEPWWQAVFRDQLSGLWKTFGPFLSREDGGTQPFTLFGDQVCDKLLEIATTDSDPAIRAEAAEAYFTPMRTQRLVRGTNTTVVILCPEGQTVLGRDYDRARGKGFLDPIARLKLTVDGGSEELKEAAAFGAAKALADLETLSEVERVLGTGILPPDGDRELSQLLADVALGGGAVDRESVLDLISLRGTTPHARLAAALALGLTWEDKIKAGKSSSVIGAITEDSLITFWWSSQVFAPSVGKSVYAERAKAIIAPLARLFASAEEKIANFTVKGRGIVGIADLKS